jgi:flagellar motility protein MotE (MotC chaperone)
MAETDSSMNSILNKSLEAGEDKSYTDKVIELQDQLLQSQERNLSLSAQARELERSVHDSDDLQSEMAAQSLILADKTRENRRLHQELSRVTTTLESKLKELEELNNQFVDLQHQLKTRELERDRLSVMLYEMESASKLAGGVPEDLAKGRDKEKESQPNEGSTSWLWHLLGKNG